MSNLISRIGTVLTHFGISSVKYNKLLRQYSSLTKKLGCVPTFPITAVTLKRHPDLIRELSQDGVEFAIHGYIHTDYGVLSFDEQLRHFKSAIDVFQNYHVPYTGFRAPFVRVNEETFQALSALEFKYDSSFVVHWDVLDKIKYTRDSWLEYERVLDFYTSQKAQDNLVLPKSIDGFVEIPVSMPDDEIMVERLGITDENEVGEIWNAILEKSYNAGELFTVQLHPERIEFCEKGLERVILRAKQFNPVVWIATLREIAGWWRERDDFTFQIDYKGNGEYGVLANCSDRATVLVKNVEVNVPADEWFDGYKRVSAQEFVLKSERCPVIVLDSGPDKSTIDLLRREGFAFEANTKSENSGLNLGNVMKLDENNHLAFLREIENSGSPLIRYWRWPNGARSALSVTGDIDSMTLNDFVLRIFENWRQKNR